MSVERMTGTTSRAMLRALLQASASNKPVTILITAPTIHRAATTVRGMCRLAGALGWPVRNVRNESFEIELGAFVHTIKADNFELKGRTPNCVIFDETID